MPTNPAAAVHDLHIEVTDRGARATCSCGKWQSGRKVDESTASRKLVSDRWYHEHYLPMATGNR